MFKCNAEIDDQSDYNEHCKRLHGVIPTGLTREENLIVDATKPFKLDDAMNIEELGTEDHWAILGIWSAKAVTSKVITKTANRRSADIIGSRSRVLVDQIIEVTPKTFSGAFEIHLKNKLEISDIPLKENGPILKSPFLRH